MAASSGLYLKELQSHLEHSFSREEIVFLCDYLGVAFEALEGNALPGKIRSLLHHLARENRLQELIELAREERPHLAWPSVPPDFELPASAAPETPGSVTQHIYYGPVEINQGDTTQFIGNFQGANLTVKSRLENASQTINNRASVDGSTRQTASTLLMEINAKLQGVPPDKQAAAEELAQALHVLVEQTAAPSNQVMVKMLGAGVLQSALRQETDVPGLVELVMRFVTAVTALT